MSLGGVLVIASILAILVVIVAEFAPLFRAPSAIPRGTMQVPLPSVPLAIGTDEYREIVYLITPGGVQFAPLASGRTLAQPEVTGRQGAAIAGVSALGRGPFALGLTDGRVIPAEVRFSVSFPGGRRSVEGELVTASPVLVAAGRAISHLAYTQTDEGAVLIAATGPQALSVIIIRQTKPLVGPPAREEVRRAVVLSGEGEITALAVDTRGDHAYVGTSAGQVARIDLGASGGARVQGVLDVTSRPGVAITALGFLLGDRTLLIGDGAGAVSSWLVVPEAGPAGLKRAHSFEPHRAAVAALAPSRRDKGFFSADRDGTIRLHYATTGKSLLAVAHTDPAMTALVYAPKADGLLTIDAGGRLSQWDIRNPHPQATLTSLFGRTLYEGYQEPTYAWQSTGATDDFEEKFSLTPLIYGTLKGTAYAMLLAVPLAILGALYASQFMHPTLKGLVKPVVEIMAALPSVVLGFLAGLWLAPMIEKVVPGLFMLPLIVSAAILLAALLWRATPARIRRRFRPGTEVIVLIPVVVLSAWIAFRLGGLVESTLLAGDYRGWLLSALGLTYDQRNSLVVGFAMGFAVIPIIFTIAEDSLSNVPPYLTAGSLALGATRWQTAINVVLPTASPGIFSALMIGFGRAVGETMIVLMATGNTPLMDWSIFNGFRALSANIAVELPEAPQGGTLYRVLFLAAFLLFVMTFVVNTAAEIVRLRLRRRYQSL